MKDDDSSQFRPVNAELGKTPSVGPVPGHQLYPWGIIVIIAWFIAKGLFGLGTLATLCVAAWLIISWTILTGRNPWRYLSKYTRVRPWTSDYRAFVSLLPQSRKRK